MEKTTKFQKKIRKLIKQANKLIGKDKAKFSKPTVRSTLPPNKVFKSKKAYKRVKKVKHEED